VTADAHSGESSEAAGVVIARLRRRARLTGQQLGALVRMSQAKISRIETAQSSLTAADAARIARALGASPEETDRLVLLAQRTRNEMTDWRQSPNVVGGIQAETAELEARTEVIRIFQPNVIVGLAQTAEYARGVLGSIEEIYEAPFGDPDAASVARALTARIQRQEVLIRPDREFHFLMGEAALSGRLITSNQMLAQIDRLRQLDEQDNVVLRFIPADPARKLPLPLLHGFELLDDSALFIDSFNTAMISRGAKDLAKYRVVFDRLEQSADPDAAAMLDKYERIYKGTSS
jgi:transcriptional regulator with XRE-family HTH domain